VEAEQMVAPENHERAPGPARTDLEVNEEAEVEVAESLAVAEVEVETDAEGEVVGLALDRRKISFLLLQLIPPFQ